MLKRIREKWWLYGGIIAILVVRALEPFKSNFLLTMVAAVVIGIVIVVLMAIVPPKPSQ